MSNEELSELIGDLSETAESIAGLVRDLADQDLRRRGAEGEFSIIENICHLRDIEAEGYVARISRIIQEERPLLSDIDGARLAIERDYNSQDSERALRVFAEARQRNVAVLSGLEPAQFERQGILEGVGAVSLHKLVLMMCEHDAGHIEDIRVICRSLNRLTSA